MIKTSQKVQDYLQTNARQFKARVLVNDKEAPGTLRNFNIKRGSCNSSFSPGTVSSSSISATLDLPSYSTQFSLKNGDKIQIQFAAPLSGDSNYYTIATGYSLGSSRKMERINIEASGTISAKLGKKNTSIKGKMNVADLIGKIKEQTGVNISLSSSCNSSYEVNADNVNGSYFSEILGNIAGLFFGYVTEDEQGTVVIKRFSDRSGTTKTVSLERMRNYPEIEDEEIVIQGVEVQGKDETYSLGEICNITAVNALMTASIFNAGAADFVNLQYLPCNAEMTLGDPTITPDDLISIDKNENSRESVMLIPMGIDITYDGGFVSIISAPTVDEGEFRGKTEEVFDTGGNTTTATTKPDDNTTGNPPTFRKTSPNYYQIADRIATLYWSRRFYYVGKEDVITIDPERDLWKYMKGYLPPKQVSAVSYLNCAPGMVTSSDMLFYAILTPNEDKKTWTMTFNSVYTEPRGKYSSVSKWTANPKDGQIMSDGSSWVMGFRFWWYLEED